MTTEDAFLIRALLHRMKMEARNPAIDRMSDEIMSLVASARPMPTMATPDISWSGNTMVVR